MALSLAEGLGVPWLLFEAHYTLGRALRAAGQNERAYAAYWSAADNLVDGDTNKVTDCFVTDRQTHETTRIDVGLNEE